MTGEPPDVTELDPFEFTKRADETDGEFVRFEATVHPLPDRSETEEGLSHRRFLLDNPDKHIHPQQEEYVEVLSGEYGVEIDGTEHLLAEGDDITLPMNTPHRHWNPTDHPIRVAHEQRPALQSEELGETLYTLAQAGNTNEKGIPSPLQFAVIMDTFPGHAYAADLPVGVQKAVFRLLGPIGRLAGYEGTHSREDIDRLR